MSRVMGLEQSRSSAAAAVEKAVARERSRRTCLVGERCCLRGYIFFLFSFVLFLIWFLFRSGCL